ncbi:MAG: hypothetical protein IJ008_00625 [Clostridia bacterium]|nr:hypothetical protein [Clostridia bacterium]
MVKFSRFFKFLLFSLSLFGLFFLADASLTQKRTIENSSEAYVDDTLVNDTLPDFFVAEDESGKNLKEDNVFLYSSSNTYIDFSFLRNAPTIISPVYNYVYFPDTSDSTTFSFFLISNLILHSNNSTTNIIDSNNDDNYISTFEETPENPTFVGNANKPQLIDLTLAVTGNTENTTIRIQEDGIYTLSIRGQVISTTDGALGLEASLWESDELSIDFKFFVLSESSYYENSRPIMTASSVETLALTSSHDYYYYYNYSLYNVNDGTAVASLPSLTYDPTRYEISINKKDPSEVESFVRVTFDKKNETHILEGDSSVLMARTTATEGLNDTKRYSTTLTFNNLGEYEISFKFIFVTNYLNTTTEDYEYYKLDKLYGNNRRLYVYGMQSVFTNYGEGRDPQTNAYNFKEFKNVHEENSTFTDSADITALYKEFLTKNSYGNRYTIDYVLRYIQNNNIKPVQTDQSPLKFLSNTTLSSNSQVYCTKNDGSFDTSSYSLNGTKLYQKQYTGKTFGSTQGYYIFILGYTYDQYQTIAGYDSSTQYQIFFLEVNKVNPTISIINDKDNSTLKAGKYTNSSVTIINDHFDDLYNTKVYIKISGYNYSNNNSIVTDYTSNVVLDHANFSDIDLDNDGIITLRNNAHYVLEIFSGKNGLNGTPETTDFYIDNNPITNLTARNVKRETNGSYTIGHSFDTFTNQNMTLSWNEKKSGAKTYAYYKKFEMSSIVYYGKDNLSSILYASLENSLETSIPVNYTVNMNLSKTKWNPCKNSIGYTTTLPADYKLADPGLYFVQVFDEAGNSTVDIFMIDNSTPLFALYNEEKMEYDFPGSTETVSTSQKLFWGKYKSIIITNLANGSFDIFNDIRSNPNMNDEEIFDKIKTVDLFKDNNGQYNVNICKTFYNKFFKNDYIQELVFPGANPDAGMSLTNYNGYYFTIPNEETYWVATPTNPNFTLQTGYMIDINADVEGKSDNYEILIRNRANTLFDHNYSLTDKIQYTNYYSNYLTLIVTKDAAEMKITYYSNNSNENITLAANDSTITTFEGSDGETYESRNAFLKPTMMEKAFSLSFIPRIENDGKITQVDTVKMYYYEYYIKTITKTVKVNGVNKEYTYYYYTYDKDNPTEEYEVYTYDSKSTSTDKITRTINVQDSITKAGVYVFERTYLLGDDYFIEEDDYARRSITLYIDRFSVISSADVTESGTVESIVGGDIFLGIYDDGTNANLMLTFPDAPFGNVNGSNLYSSDGLISSSSISVYTNKLPVNVYVPAYKYTQNVDYVESENNYQFNVNRDDTMNVKYNEVVNETPVESVIEEYKLFSTIIYTPTTGITNTPIRYSSVGEKNGFLTFADSHGNEVSNFTNAGIYRVRIYQGYYSIAGENSFNSYIEFQFEITAPAPEFNIYDSRGSSLADYNGTLYTNQDELKVVWTDPTYDYSAKIDKEQILVTTSTGYNHMIDSSLIETEDNQNTLTLHLSDLNDAYTEGATISIKMIFEGNNAYYKPTTKTIVVDKLAPTQNINTLLQNTLSSLTANSITSVTSASLREFYGVDGSKTTEGSESYNVSASTGMFAYYSYSVTSEYFATLFQTLATNSSLPTQTQEVYYRSFELLNAEGKLEFDSITGIPNSSKYNELFDSETYYSDFATAQGSLNLLSKTSLEELTDSLINNMYYEIIERDLAGNLTIYSIFVYSDETVNEKDQKEYNNLITYTNNKNGEEVQAYSIDDLDSTYYNIYSPSGFEFKKINWFGDEWNQFNIKYYDATIGNYITLYLMASPYLSQGEFYDLSKNDGTIINISSLLKDYFPNQKKNTISFTDRYTGKITNIYLTIWDTNLTTAISSIEDYEYIDILQPTDSQLADTSANSYVYATSVKIEFYYDDIGYTEIYYKDNLFGTYSAWKATEFDLVGISNLSGYTRWLINTINLENNQRVKYTIVDNFGNVTTKVHLYNEYTNYLEIDSTNTLYSYYNDESELVYITKDSFIYTYNTSKYNVTIYNANNEMVYDTQADINDANSTGSNITKNRIENYDTILRLTISHVDETLTKNIKYWNESYRIELRELSDLNVVVNNIYFRLYNNLPVSINSQEDKTKNLYYYYFTDTNGNIITDDLLNGVSYYSEVTFYCFGDTDVLDYPYSYYISRDNGETFEPLVNGKTISCTTTTLQNFVLKIAYDFDNTKLNQSPTSTYLFEYDYVYENFILSSSLSNFYYITKENADGSVEEVKLSGQTYVYGTTSYSRHYIVNLDYSDRSLVSIVLNEEQNVKIMNEGEPVYRQISDSTGVYTDIWYISNSEALAEKDNLSKFSAYIAITYIAPSNNISRLFYLSTEGINENLINSYQATIVANEDQENFDKLKLSWSKYYGISQNKINIILSKDGNELDPIVYEDNSYYYVLLTRSGTYNVQLKDIVGNYQTFNAGSTGETQTLKLIFLKDVPFTMTYTNPLTNELQTTEPVNHAIYNGIVTINIPTSTLAAYYTTTGAPTIQVTRNGKKYSGYTTNSRSSWTFEDMGHYSVSFTATSLATGNVIRKEVYFFTIMNSEESRYSYEFTKYSNYYIQNVYKMVNNEYVDITKQLLSTLSYSTIQSNGKTYFSELVLTYLDEKTGSGRYIVTVNTNENLYSSSSIMTTYTFKLWINVGSTPVKVSLEEGKSTTGKIDISFNPANIFAEVGESYIRVISYPEKEDGYYLYYNYIINASSASSTQSYQIEDVGEFYIQIYTTSGNLLYSYKVVRKEPLNTFAIIFIIVAVAILLLVIILIYRLRKKVSVK